MLALVLACIAQGNPKQTLDAFVAAEAANSKQSLTIVVSSNLSGTSTKTTYELAFTRPNRLRMEVRENTPPTDRVFTINRNVFTAYDRLSNQVLTRKVRADGTLGEKLADAFGEVDEPVMLVINPSKAREFAGRMEALPGWRVFHSSLLTVLDYKSAATHTSAAIGLRFFGDKPRQMTFKTSDKALNWLFEEHPPVRISNLVIPKTAKHVNTFYERAKPPTYADFGTKQTIENAIQAYDQLKSVEYRVRAGSETTRVIWQENSARQDDAVLKWSYHQGQLTIYAIKSGELFRGATALRHVPDYLHALGGSIDPTLRLLLSGRNPIEVLFAPGTKAQTVAQSSAHGVILQVVELSRPMLKIQLQFRSGQPLPVSVGVENLDAASRVVSQSERNFEYLAENQPYSGSTFRVGDSGQGAFPLLAPLYLPKSK